MKAQLLHNYAFNLRYAHALVIDVDHETMTQAPHQGLENHPAFTLGHLVSGAALTVKYLGGAYDLDPAWEQTFKRKGPGDPRLPDANAAAYPSKNELLAELARQHARVEAHIRELDEAQWNAPAKWRFHSDMPTLGDLLIFMCLTHESMHLGQLAAWRRAMGLPSALATL